MAEVCSNFPMLPAAPLELVRDNASLIFALWCRVSMLKKIVFVEFESKL